MIRLFVICVTILGFILVFSDQHVRFKEYKIQRRPASQELKKEIPPKKTDYFRLKNYLKRKVYPSTKSV